MSKNFSDQTLVNKQSVNVQDINGYPQLFDKNWVKIGHVTQLYMYPLKSGGKVCISSTRCNQYGMVNWNQQMPNIKIWDGMFLVYNQKTKTIANFANYWKLVLININVNETFMQFNGIGIDSLIIEIDKQTRKYCKVFYYSSWHGGTPTKLRDCGAKAAKWINEYLGTSDLRLVQRVDCNPLHEEPNFIRENWMEYNMIYSTKAEEKTEAFANVTRCVLMTTSTLDKLQKDIIHNDEHHLIRPNIVVSASSIPYSEEDWEWIKIKNIIIRVIKPVPRYLIKPFALRFLTVFAHELYIRDKEEETAHLGVYCASFISGNLQLNDDVYVYKTDKEFFSYNY
ncbi:mitochondrial amidoxime reducing component 2-like [Temnothorax curvispinosus]|uniref:Mitochondrial amidoxime reducing component 2-like n=1 Tax=Temnothorax curvispinosus TaxID=300111 RepID=A0A6J1Q438_9HYME|nr:mitochondrial amidoxime reducing component 2-like [Temnothorax curvispinosus]